MQPSQTASTELDLLLSQLTPRIQADLPIWYGPNAKLQGAPTFSPRPWSFFFRYAVQVSDSETKAVLVKIRHAKDMGISEAAASAKMKGEAAMEFESLSKIRNIFVGQNDASLFATIRPLALYEELSAVVAEEADIRDLRSYFQTPAMWLGQNQRKLFAGYLNRVGHWLRIFHDQVGTITTGPFWSEQHYRETLENLSTIAAVSPHPDLTLAKALITNLYQKYSNAELPQRILHNDFNSANVFVTGDGRICSFDPKNEPGPLYIDLAKLITDLEMCRFQTLTWGRHVSRSQLDVFNASLLHGYFGSDPVNFAALNLFRLTHLIERWAESETMLIEATGVKKIIYTVGVIQMRGYYRQLLRWYVSEQDYGV
jgi:hypothetical protein